MNKITKMYTVCSPMPSFDSYKGDWVSVWWYRADKVRDGLQYGDIIKGYNDMTQEDKRLTEIIVNQLFTPEEVKVLRHFVEEELERELIVEFKIDLSQPILEQEYYGPINELYGEDIIYLNMLEGYNLPFEVRGHYIPESGDPVIKHWDPDKFRKPTKKQ